MYKLKLFVAGISLALCYTSCCTQGARSGDIFVAVKGNQSHSQIEVTVNDRAQQSHTWYFSESSYYKLHSYNYNICKGEEMPRISISRQSAELLRVVCAEDPSIPIGNTTLQEIMEAESQGESVAISSDSAFQYLKESHYPYYFEVLPNESQGFMNLVPFEE